MNTLKTSEKCGIIETLNWIESWEKKNSSLNKTEKLKSLKSNIDSKLIPDDPDATVESIINSILYDQKFNKLEDELAKADNISEFENSEIIFKTKKMNVFLEWEWDVTNEVCAICRNEMVDSCMRCQAENTNKICTIVWGKCGHSFHHHCMQLWLEHALHNVQRCPLCQQEWIHARIGN